MNNRAEVVTFSQLPDDFNLGKITSLLTSSGSSFQRLSFGGVVGRLAWVVVAASIGIAYATGHTTQVGALIGILAIVFVVLVMAGVIVYVVKTKPELSILDGGQVINYKQLTLGAKGFVLLDELPPVPDPASLELPTKAEKGEQS